jgi:hypothetical protein
MSIDELPNRGQARGSDPRTSKDAAALVRPGSQRRLLLEAHVRQPGGLTDEEAAISAGISLASEYATRCSELMRAGLLRDTGRTRSGSSGMHRIVRILTDAGHAALGSAPPRPSVPPGECSCGRGPVGHASTHQSTETPGVVRIVREGKTDQYMNIRQVEAQAADAAQAHRAEDERKRIQATPRVVLRAKDLGIGVRICERCKGTGGNLLEKCLYCDGKGIR